MNQNQNMVTKQIKLDGLSCSACELKIEKAVNKINGVEKVNVSYSTSIMTVTYDKDKASLEFIKKVIEKAGYQVVEDSPVAEEKKEKSSYLSIGAIAILIVAFYLIIKNTIGFYFIPEVTPQMGYGVLFLVGLATSIHCVAMCGGINLSQCISATASGSAKKSKYDAVMPSLLYNSGRVLSYTIVGGIVGALGSVISISNNGKAIISVLAGVFMLIMGLNMLNIFPTWLRKLNPRIPKGLARKVNQSKQNKGPFVVGMLNGLMPCGPLQAMQVYALGTGSLVAGALSMFFFSVGTVPLMFFVGAVSTFFSGAFTKKMKLASAVLVMVLGVIMMNRGVALAGVVLPTTSNSKTETSQVTTQGNAAQTNANSDVQEISTTLEAGSYPKLTVTKGIPVKWTITADANSLNGCNGTIVIPKYNIQQKLKVGENVITFTPSESGNFGYSCWMGMIQSSISVVDATTSDISSNSADSSQATNSSTAVDTTGMPKGCCGIQ